MMSVTFGEISSAPAGAWAEASGFRGLSPPANIGQALRASGGPRIEFVRAIDCLCSGDI